MEQNMTDDTPPQYQPRGESALWHQVNLAIEDPRYCRIICRYLLDIAPDERIADALRHLVDVRHILGDTKDEYVTRLAELEMERARFLDPNRPGE
jgi:hypothetical protein